MNTFKRSLKPHGSNGFRPKKPISEDYQSFTPAHDSSTNSGSWRTSMNQQIIVVDDSSVGSGDKKDGVHVGVSNSGLEAQQSASVIHPVSQIEFTVDESNLTCKEKILGLKLQILSQTYFNELINKLYNIYKVVSDKTMFYEKNKQISKNYTTLTEDEYETFIKSLIDEFYPNEIRDKVEVIVEATKKFISDNEPILRGKSLIKKLQLEQLIEFLRTYNDYINRIVLTNTSGQKNLYEVYSCASKIIKDLLHRFKQIEKIIYIRYLEIDYNQINIQNEQSIESIISNYLNMVRYNIDNIDSQITANFNKSTDINTTLNLYTTFGEIYINKKIFKIKETEQKKYLTEYIKFYHFDRINKYLKQNINQLVNENIELDENITNQIIDETKSTIDRLNQFTRIINNGIKSKNIDDTHYLSKRSIQKIFEIYNLIKENSDNFDTFCDLIKYESLHQINGFVKDIQIQKYKMYCINKIKFYIEYTNDPTNVLKQFYCKLMYSSYNEMLIYYKYNSERIIKEVENATNNFIKIIKSIKNEEKVTIAYLKKIIHLGRMGFIQNILDNLKVYSINNNSYPMDSTFTNLISKYNEFKYTFIDKLLVNVNNITWEFYYNKEYLIHGLVNKSIFSNFESVFKTISEHIYKFEKPCTSNSLSEFKDRVEKVSRCVEKIMTRLINIQYALEINKYELKTSDINIKYIHDTQVLKFYNLITECFIKNNFDEKLFTENRFLIKENNYNQMLTDQYDNKIKKFECVYKYNSTNKTISNEIYYVEPHIYCSDHQLKLTRKFNPYMKQLKPSDNSEDDITISTWNLKSKIKLDEKIHEDPDNLDRRHLQLIFDNKYNELVKNETEYEINRYNKLFELLTDHNYFPKQNILNGKLPDIMLIQECSLKLLDMIKNLEQYKVKGKIAFMHQNYLDYCDDPEAYGISEPIYVVLINNPDLEIIKSEPYTIAWKEFGIMFKRNDGMKNIIHNTKNNKYFTVVNVNCFPSWSKGNFRVHFFGKSEIRYEEESPLNPKRLFYFEEEINDQKCKISSFIIGGDFDIPYKSSKRNCPKDNLNNTLESNEIDGVNPKFDYLTDIYYKNNDEFNINDHIVAFYPQE